MQLFFLNSYLHGNPKDNVTNPITEVTAYANIASGYPGAL